MLIANGTFERWMKAYLIGLKETFQELGPFLNNPDLETLYENVYSWHKVSSSE